jgi:hypothetical protein
MMGVGRVILVVFSVLGYNTPLYERFTQSTLSLAVALDWLGDVMLQPERSEVATFFLHLRALLVKRWINAKRDKKSQCFQLVVPALLVLIGLVIIKAFGNPLVQPDLVLSPAMFNPK